VVAVAAAMVVVAVAAAMVAWPTWDMG
jgi:hypothetical protein